MQQQRELLSQLTDEELLQLKAQARDRKFNEGQELCYEGEEEDPEADSDEATGFEATDLRGDLANAPSCIMPAGPLLPSGQFYSQKEIALQQQQLVESPLESPMESKI